MTGFHQLCSITFLLAFGTTSVLARVVNPSPNCVISIVGPETTSLSRPAQIYAEGFAVRLTDAQGAPLPGLKVNFSVRRFIPFPGFPPDPNPPEAYGTFESTSAVTADVQGIARSSAFTGGTALAVYETEADLFTLFPENRACDNPLTPTAYFLIVQDFTMQIPAVSRTSLLLLITLMTFAFCCRGWSYLQQRRRW